MIAGNVIAPISRIAASDLLPDIDHEPTMDDVLQTSFAGNMSFILETWKKKYYDRKRGATMGNAVSDKKNARCFSLKLSRNTDKELIEHLEQQQNIQAYIKELIRQDMKRTQG